MGKPVLRVDLVGPGLIILKVFLHTGNLNANLKS